MTENEYFDHLEYRVCRELAGMRDAALRDWWCDGLVADAFDVVGRRCRVTGRAWVGRDGQECWQFALYLGPARPREQIDWAAVLPPEDVTGWLSMDFRTKFMKLNPLAARADGEPAAT